MINPNTLTAARRLLAQGDVSAQDVANALHLSVVTARKALKHLHQIGDAHVAFYQGAGRFAGLPRPYYRAGAGQDARRPGGGGRAEISASSEALRAANPFNLTTK